MYEPMPPAFYHEPRKIAEDTFLIQQLTGEGHAPVNVYVNSLLIRGKQPTIVDTGAENNREQWFRDIFSIVDPKDVRWLFISHDDPDHTGNVAQVLQECPNATLVGTWFMWERMATAINLPLDRMLWLNDGESLDAGDRTFGAMRPPMYDSPTTRGLFDSKTGVYWGSDAFGAPVLAHTEHVAELDQTFWREAYGTFHHMNSPWLGLVDQQKFSATVDRLQKLGITTIASAHGPIVTGKSVAEAFELTHNLPDVTPAPAFGDQMRQEMVAAIREVHAEAAA